MTGYKNHMTSERSWPYWLIGGFGLFSVAVYVVKPGSQYVLKVNPGSEFVLKAFTDLIAVGAAAIAFAAVAYVSRRRRDIQAAAGWFWLAVGLGLYMLGEAAWAFQEIVLKINNPFPSVADIFWLGAYPPLLLGLIIAWRQLDIGLQKKEVAAIWVAAVAAFAATAVWLFVPIIRTPDVPITEKVLDIAYPLADILLIVPALALAVAFGRSLLGRPWRLICVGLIFIGLADLSFAYLTWHRVYWMNVEAPANFIDLLWVIGYLTIGVAGFYYDQILAGSQ